MAAGTGDVLMARLRAGRAHTVRGAAPFLHETVRRVRDAGASGQLTVRADSGFYARSVVAVCRKLDVRCSITIRQQPSVRRRIEAIPEEQWTPIEYWLPGGADVAEMTYTPFQDSPDAAPVRLIVRRVRPTPGSQLALFANYSYHGFITDRTDDAVARGRPSPPRRGRERDPGPQVRCRAQSPALRPLRRQRRWLAVQVIAHNLARWTARLGLGEGIVTTRTLRRRLCSLPGRFTRSARRLTLPLPERWPWAGAFTDALARLRALPLPT